MTIKRMGGSMKFFTLFFFFVFAVTAFSQSSQGINLETISKADLAVLGYTECLSIGNEGTVESAMCNLLRFSYRYPEANLEGLDTILIKLSRTSKNAKIRTKAILVYQLLKNPELIKEMGDTFYDDMEKLINVMCCSISFQRTKTNIISLNDFTFIE